MTVLRGRQRESSVREREKRDSRWGRKGAGHGGELISGEVRSPAGCEEAALLWLADGGDELIVIPLGSSREVSGWWNGWIGRDPEEDEEWRREGLMGQLP